MRLYKLLGLALTVIGLGLILFSFFYFGAISLVASGLSIVILGFTGICLGYAPSGAASAASGILSRAGMENINAILLSLEVKNQAVYFPRKVFEGHPQALIPLDSDADSENLRAKFQGLSLLKLMPDSDRPSIAVTTPGNLSLALLPEIPSGIDEIQPALQWLLTRELGVASGVKVKFEETHIVINVKGAENIAPGGPSDRCLGSPIASIAAAVACEAFGKPVKILEENSRRSNLGIVLEVQA
jgi:hypothetical protein